MLLAMYAPVPLLSHITITLPCLGNANSCIAAAATTAVIPIAIIVAATVASGHQHQGTMQRWMQPMLDCYNLPMQITCADVRTFALLKPPSLVITMCNQYTASVHGIGTIVGVHMWAPELASAAQLSSRGSYSTVLQTKCYDPEPYFHFLHYFPPFILCSRSLVPHLFPYVPLRPPPNHLISHLMDHLTIPQSDITCHHSAVRSTPQYHHLPLYGLPAHCHVMMEPPAHDEAILRTASS